MSKRPWRERQYDPSRLVVARPGWLGRGYAEGQRFRPEREAISDRRARQLFDARVLLTDEEYHRLSGEAPEPEGDWISGLTREQLFEQLREVGESAGPNSRDETLRRKLREALQ